jgi:alanine racemase
MDTSAYSTWLEIDCDAIRTNLRELRRISGRPVMAVVKANGYGHGIVEAGRAALQGGASWLGVARIEEALVLRAARLTCPILVLGYTSPLRAGEAAVNGVSLAVYDPDLAAAYSDVALKLGRRIRVHAKFDSGMGRLGVFPEDGVAFIRQLAGLPALEVEGMFTHFARSDEPGLVTTAWQNERFAALVNALGQCGLRPPLVHASNSAAALYFPETHYDLVRCGIAIYGLHPSAEAPLPETFRPALTWKAHLSSVKLLPPEHGVGYSYRYTTHKQERIGAVAVGYADGLRRRVGNFALVGGKRVRLAGGVCMDQIMLQLDEVPEAKIGDEVVLLGRQGEALITAEEIAREWGTVNYDVVCGLQARVPRIYMNGMDETV